MDNLTLENVVVWLLGIFATTLVGILIGEPIKRLFRTNKSKHAVKIEEITESEERKQYGKNGELLSYTRRKRKSPPASNLNTPKNQISYYPYKYCQPQYFFKFIKNNSSHFLKLPFSLRSL